MSSFRRCRGPPTQSCWSFSKLCRIGSSLLPHDTDSSSLGDVSRVGSLSSTSCPSAVDHARIAGRIPDRYGLVGADFDVQVAELGGLKLKFPRHALSAGRVAHFVQVTRVKSGSGVVAIAAQQWGAMEARKCGNAAWKRRRSSPRPATSGCGLCASRRGKVLAHDRGDLFFGGLGQHQVHLGLVGISLEASWQQWSRRRGSGSVTPR